MTDKINSKDVNIIENKSNKGDKIEDEIILKEDEIILKEDEIILKEDEEIIPNVTESLVNNSYEELKKFSLDYIKNFSITEEQYPLFVNVYIEESIKLNLPEKDILNNINQFVLENLLYFRNVNFNKINERLIKSRFTISKIKNMKKISHINNINIILRNTTFHLNKIIKDKEITIGNMLENIYEITEDAIEFVSQYNIKDVQKNKTIIKVITDIIEHIINEMSSLTEEEEELVKNIKDIIQNILPIYIESFVELDINEETIIQSKNCLKKICCMIINKN